MRLIGLTGNIACGKSTVAQILRERGFVVIDADQVSREASEPGGRAFERILEVFGRKVLSRESKLDRGKLRAMVFSDPAKRKLLENILHPEIRRLSEEKIAQAFQSGQKTVIYEAPLLIEAGRLDAMEGVLVVTCDPELQKRRLLSRDASLNDELARKMILAQMSQAEKVRLAKWVIENSGSEDELRRKVEDWIDQVVGGARGPS